MTTLAIADIHGCYAQLELILQNYCGQDHDVIFLGDYIDRAKEEDGDINVLNKVEALTQDPLSHGFNSCIALLGNHEEMFMESVEEDNFNCWESNGGNTAAIPELKQHLEWLYSLPRYEQRGAFLFVHAGVRPGVALADQDPEDLLWIRRPFLTCKDHGLPWTVVHGHSITQSFEIEEHPGRIAMDCGSFATGRIGHAVFDC